MLLGDLVEMAVRPWRRAPRLAEGRPLGLAVAVVVATGLLCCGISLAAIALEPQEGAQRAVDIGFSVILPALFAGIWLIDALVVDAVTQLMGRRTMWRRYLEVTAYALPVLSAGELVRLLQAVIDHGAGSQVGATSTAVGSLYFLVIVWFVVAVTAAVRAVYDLPVASALAAALAPPAALAMVLMLLIIVTTILGGGPRR